MRSPFWNASISALLLAVACGGDASGGGDGGAAAAGGASGSGGSSGSNATGGTGGSNATGGSSGSNATGGTGGTGGAGASGGGGTAGASAGPGEVTVQVRDLAGYQGKVLLGFLYPVGGAVQQSTTGMCVPLNVSPASFDEALKARKLAVQDPCQLETTPQVIDAGSYQLFFGIYTPGSQTPEACATTSVTVQGDTVVVLPVLGACS